MIYVRLLRRDKKFSVEFLILYKKKPDVSERFLCSKTFQNTANLCSILHIVNDSVDILYNKRLFSREVIKNTFTRKKKIGVIVYLSLRKYVCLCQCIDV